MNYLPNNNFDNFYSQYEAPLPSDVFSDDTESSFQNASKKISKSDIEVRQKINRKKHNRTRNPWTSAEDKKVIELMNKHGQNWALISAGMEGRTGKQIRDRYLNKLNPNIKKCGDWSAAEDDTMMKLINEVGNRWSLIASHLPGRTEGQVKNRYYSSMKRKLETNGIVSQTSGGSTVSETVSNLLESPHQDEGLKLDFGLDFDPTTMAFDLESAMNTARAYKHKGPIIFEDSYLNEVTAQDFILQNKNPCAATESVLSFDLVQPTDFFLSPVEENKGQPEDVLGKVINYFDNTPNAVSGVDAYFFDELRSQKMDSDFGMPDKQTLLAKRKAYLELALAKTIKEMKSF